MPLRIEGSKASPTASSLRRQARLGRRRIPSRPCLPDRISACLFDLDGVLTQTAKIHAEAWKETFDAFLLDRSQRTGEPFRPFEFPADYLEHVHGKLRTDGVRAFLASRGIGLPEGSDDDPPTAETVHGLETRKNDLVLELIRSRGVDVYEGSIRFAEAARDSSPPPRPQPRSGECREPRRPRSRGAASPGDGPATQLLLR